MAARAFGKDVGSVSLRSDDFGLCDCVVLRNEMSEITLATQLCWSHKEGPSGGSSLLCTETCANTVDCVHGCSRQLPKWGRWRSGSPTVREDGGFEAAARAHTQEFYICCLCGTCKLFMA